MPPPSASSLFTVCCRCQLRAAPRTKPPTRAISVRSVSRLSGYSAFDGTPYAAHPNHGPKTKSGQELIVLPPPGPRQPLTDIDGLREAVGPLGEADLAELSQSILIYEQEAVLDATKMEISLLKPLEKRVSKQRFEQLYEQLYQAFNISQLRNYYDSARPDSSSSPKLSKAPTKMDTIRWIMKYRWGMVIAEEIAEREDVIVTETIESNKRDIFFLIGEDGRILRYWAQRGNVRITVDVAKNLLSIRGSRASIELIQRWLEAYLKDVVTEVMDLSATSRIAPFGDAVIPVIARMTNTYIERIDDNTLKIAGLGPTRDRMDDARRLLFTSIDLRLRTKESLLFNPPLESAKMGALFPSSEGSALPWTFRNQNLGRWKLIKRKPMGGFNTPKFSMETFSVIRRVEGGRGSQGAVLEALDEMGGTISENQRRHGLKTEYEAVLGHLLYEISTDDDNLRAGGYELEMSDFIRKTYGKPRILCNAFPGIPVFAQDPIGRSNFEIPPPPLQGATSKEYFQLRFLPSPWSKPSSFECYPPIRMVVEIDQQGTPRNPEIYAVGSESNADVLLPGLSCDLRFLRRDEATLQVRDDIEQGGVAPQEWARFMAESSLNPSLDLKLRASPNLQINIPPWVTVPSSHTSKHSTAVPIDYQFTGMEYRRMVSLQNQGYVLSRTVVEGGVSGGRKTEVRLKYVPSSASPGPANGDYGDIEGEEFIAPRPVSPEEAFVTFVDKAVSFVASVDNFLGRKPPS